VVEQGFQRLAVQNTEGGDKHKTTPALFFNRVDNTDGHIVSFGFSVSRLASMLQVKQISGRFSGRTLVFQAS
jgi:hypothetical protein